MIMKNFRDLGISLKLICRLIVLVMGLGLVSLKKIRGTRARKATPPAIRKMVLNPKL